ncbi:MAG: hypothetical protein OEY59_00945 [Deltaproteobacteria bacterium]|nr:hypothetical protein [Deltaproteobacteria bacterium]
MKRLIIAAVFLFIAGLPASLFAGEFRDLGQDYRSLAMGNTGIASANNSSALFYNPATLSNIYNWWFDFPMLEVTASSESMALYGQAKTGSFNLETQDEQFDFMRDFIGQNPYIKFRLGSNIFFNVLKQGMSVGANYTYEAVLDIQVRNPSLPTLDAFARLDHVRQAGISIPMAMGRFILGVVRKQIERKEVAFNYGMSDAIDEVPFPTMDTDGKSGAGEGYDVGFIFRTASKSRIQIGGVYRQEIDLQDATKIPKEIAFGASMVHNFGNLRFTGAVDLRDITSELTPDDKTNYNRRLRYGAELGLFPLSRNTTMFSFRTGYSNGYPSTGVEMYFGHAMIIGYTRYIEETGEYAGQNPSSRQVAYASFGF